MVCWPIKNIWLFQKENYCVHKASPADCGMDINMIKWPLWRPSVQKKMWWRSLWGELNTGGNVMKWRQLEPLKSFFTSAPQTAWVSPLRGFLMSSDLGNFAFLTTDSMIAPAEGPCRSRNMDWTWEYIKKPERDFFFFSLLVWDSWDEAGNNMKQRSPAGFKQGTYRFYLTGNQEFFKEKTLKSGQLDLILLLECCCSESEGFIEALYQQKTLWKCFQVILGPLKAPDLFQWPVSSHLSTDSCNRQKTQWIS